MEPHQADAPPTVVLFPEAPMSLRLILISEACVMRLHYQMSVMNIKHNDSYSPVYTNTPSASRRRRVRSDVLTVFFPPLDLHTQMNQTKKKLIIKRL